MFDRTRSQSGRVSGARERPTGGDVKTDTTAAPGPSAPKNLNRDTKAAAPNPPPVALADGKPLEVNDPEPASTSINRPNPPTDPDAAGTDNGGDQDRSDHDQGDHDGIDDDSREPFGNPPATARRWRVSGDPLGAPGPVDGWTPKSERDPPIWAGGVAAPRKSAPVASLTEPDPMLACSDIDPVDTPIRIGGVTTEIAAAWAKSAWT